MHPSAAQFRWPAIYSRSKVICVLLQHGLDGLQYAARAKLYESFCSTV